MTVFFNRCDVCNQFHPVSTNMTTELGFADLQAFMHQMSGNLQMFGDIRADDLLFVNSNDLRSFYSMLWCMTAVWYRAPENNSWKDNGLILTR